MLLELFDIYAGYNGRDILRGISLAIDSSEIICIIGPNGAGKSTVLRVIFGLLAPKRGTVRYNGRNVTTVESHKRASLGIAYFLQGGEVFSDMSVYENLEMGGASLTKTVFRQRLDEMLNLFPILKDRLNERTGLLSGGQRQILALGMILLNRPNLLLLDEPSAGLTPGLVKGIMGKIVEINKAYGTAILLVEQKIGEALKVADRGYLVEHGVVALDSKTDGLKSLIIKKGLVFE